VPGGRARTPLLLLSLVAWALEIAAVATVARKLSGGGVAVLVGVVGGVVAVPLLVWALGGARRRAVLCFYGLDWAVFALLVLIVTTVRFE
jgi:uncharacterized membrane protein